MAREINKLAARRITTERRPGRHADGGGLYLSISENGGRRWVFLFKRNGKSREMGLGGVSGVGLALARTLAEAARADLAKGLDPIAERDARQRAAMDALTFEQCAELFLKSNESGWRNEKHRAQWRSTLKKYVYPTIGNKAAANVDTGDVMGILEPLWGVKTETASRVRGRIEAVLDWARARGHRTGENPARWKGHLDHLLPKRSKVARVRHHPALPYTELPAFMVDLRSREGTAALALEFAILTAARTGATIGATIGEFDVAAKIWTVAPERAGTKISGDNPEARRVPLSSRAVEIVNMFLTLHGDGAPSSTPLFPGEGKGEGLSNNAMLALLERMERSDITVHGFRSTFKDWVSECTSFPNHVSEAALWHAVADKVEAAYRRGDLLKKRTALMAAWGAREPPVARWCPCPRRRWRREQNGQGHH
jgi:integrase